MVSFLVVSNPTTVMSIPFHLSGYELGILYYEPPESILRTKCLQYWGKSSQKVGHKKEEQAGNAPGRRPI